MKKFIAVLISCSMVSGALCAATPANKTKKKTPIKTEEKIIKKETSQPASTDTVKDAAPQQTVIITTVPVVSEDYTQLNSAVAGLNYKIEYLNTRNTQLGKDIEELRLALQEQKRLIVEQGMRVPSEEKINEMESELSLFRSEQAQIREDIGVMKSSKIVREGEDIQQEKKWYEAEWVLPVVGGISVLALLVAVFRK
ncbi:MAG: hypothetical protein ABII64_01220 [Elusimicrobiota bacterium]